MHAPLSASFRPLVAVVVLVALWEARATEPRLASPQQAVADGVYLQETSRPVSHPRALTAVAALGSRVFAGTSQGVLRLEGDAFVEDAGLREPVQRLVVANERLWALTSPGLHRLDTNGWRRLSTEPVADVTAYRGRTIAASGGRLSRVEVDRLVPLTDKEAPFNIARLLEHNESLALLGPGRLTTFAADQFGGLDAYGFPADQGWDWGQLPSPNTRDILSAGALLYIATDRGLGVLRGMSLVTVRGEQGLPFEDIACLAAGSGEGIWIGTSRGVIRHVGNAFHYFAGRRWLPDDRVHALAVSGGSTFVATDGGLGIIALEPHTLANKAACYERHIEEWGQKRLGFVHKLEWDPNLQEYVRQVSDNDGGYSGNYLAAESYRYAVTRDPAARREATNTFHALRWLEAITGIPGFPARAVWAKGERARKPMHGSGNYPAEWHDAADKRFEWKGDTSSDEICSHFHACSVFLELAAQGEEVAQARNHLARIATHIIDHGWRLVDLDGQPTRWGRWDPDYFQTDGGRFDRALQALEALSFMKTAEHFTGDPKFGAAYRRLIELGYHRYVLRQRTSFPSEDIAHFDDELAFWSYWNLLRFENDPDLRALYRRAFERGFEAVRIEQNPWYNFVYGALTGNDCEARAAVAHLREWPLDLRVWTYRNSHRSDLRTPPGHMVPIAGVRPFSPREREPMRWDDWTMQADGGSDGKEVADPSGWLLAYWMGRHYGFIQPPAATGPSPSTSEAAPREMRGAKPYDGPTRPAGF